MAAHRPSETHHERQKTFIYVNPHSEIKPPAMLAFPAQLERSVQQVTEKQRCTYLLSAGLRPGPNSLESALEFTVLQLHLVILLFAINESAKHYSVGHYGIKAGPDESRRARAGVSLATAKPTRQAIPLGNIAGRSTRPRRRWS